MRFQHGLKVILLAALIGLFSASMVSCEYEFIEVEEVDINEPVSFSEDILPIFTSNDNCTACHKPGQTSPDLTPGAAYNSIVPNLINTTDPSTSKIYQYPNPSSATHGFKKYTQVQAGKVLAWITQGAENN